MYSCQENPMDRGAWWAIVHRVTKSDTTEWLSTTQHSYTWSTCDQNTHWPGEAGKNISLFSILYSHGCVLRRSRVFDSRRPNEPSPPGSSGHGIFQARILSGLPFLPPGDLSDPEIQPVSCVSWIGKQIPYYWTTWETHLLILLVILLDNEHILGHKIINNKP